MEPQTRYARSEGGHVGFQVVGDGPLDIVFVPDWVTNVDAMWEEPSLARFLRRLASFSRLLCFDKRGSGVSDPVPLGSLPTMEQWMDDVRAVMDAVGSERAALFGHAEGGPMATLFAATYPERVSALVLADTFARLLRDSDYPHGLPAQAVETWLGKFGEFWGTGANADIVAPSVAEDPRFRQWYGRYERLAMAPGAAVASYRTMFEIDLRAVLPTLRVPTLVLHRAGNHHIRVGHGRYLGTHIAGAKYVELPGGDHVFHVGESDLMLNEVQAFLTGVNEVPEEDRVLATVLFADMVGSTELVAQIGDRRWRDLLDGYYHLARQELGRFRGREVDTAGDGFFATFDGPARAIRCACALHGAVKNLGITIRAGLHTGECELVGDDVRGIAVHIGARVVARAQPGEVLVSSTVKDLVAGSGIRFIDRGIHALKGVPGEWRLFAANA